MFGIVNTGKGPSVFCNAPGQFEPENGKTANMLEYEELPMEGGMFTAKEVSAHEKNNVL